MESIGRALCRHSRPRTPESCEFTPYCLVLTSFESFLVGWSSKGLSSSKCGSKRDKTDSIDNFNAILRWQAQPSIPPIRISYSSQFQTEDFLMPLVTWLLHDLHGCYSHKGGSCRRVILPTRNSNRVGGVMPRPTACFSGG